VLLQTICAALLEAAKALALTFPQPLLVRADEVIE